MKPIAMFFALATATFAVAGVLLRRPPSWSGQASRGGDVTAETASHPVAERPAPLVTPAVRTEGAARRAQPLGRSLLDDERWNDLLRASISDPRANLLIGALVSWVSQRSRRCLPSIDEARANSAVRVVVRMSSTAESAAIDGHAADVRVIEGAPLDEKTLQCVRDAIAASDTVTLASNRPSEAGCSRRAVSQEEPGPRFPTASGDRRA